MRIALDATYSLGDGLSGVGVYSREILHGLAATDRETRFDWFYRSQRFFRSYSSSVPSGVTRRFLSDNWGNRSADLFHGLNQRLPERRFRRQVTTFHDLFVLTGEYSTPEFRERFARQARSAARRADRVIAVSAFTAVQVKNLLGVETARIRIIPHGVVPRVLPSIEKKKREREKIVLTVGALQRRKNQKAIIEAFAAMPGDWTLVLAGSSGYGSEEIVEAARASPAASRIRITGYVSDSDLSDWYARASLFVFPSLDEGFGIPVLEAMAAGVPVVSSNSSALAEVCGEAAMLVDPSRTDEIAAAMRDLAQNESRRSELTARGLEHSSRYTWQRAVTATAGVYRELLD